MGKFSSYFILLSFQNQMPFCIMHLLSLVNTRRCRKRDLFIRGDDHKRQRGEGRGEGRERPVCNVSLTLLKGEEEKKEDWVRRALDCAPIFRKCNEGSSSDSLEKEDLCRAEMARPIEGRSLSGAVPSQSRAQ